MGHATTKANPKDSVLENGVKWVLLSHNTKLGAAKGAFRSRNICSTRPRSRIRPPSLETAIELADSPALSETCGPRIILHTPSGGASRGWASRSSSAL